MEIYHVDTTGKLFPASICSDDSVFFHGKYENNVEKIESEGIQRPRYPEPVLFLIEEYREIATFLDLSHALSTYQETY